jgi:hypothetical protein
VGKTLLEQKTQLLTNYHFAYRTANNLAYWVVYHKFERSTSVLYRPVADSTTWRCKECYAWDYKANEGTYQERNSHYSGINGL